MNVEFFYNFKSLWETEGKKSTFGTKVCWHCINLNGAVFKQMAPPGGPQQQSQQQPAQAPPGSAEAQLISFD